MFDAQCDLAALVYERDQDPDAVLRAFAANLNARGVRAGGMVQAGQCADASLSAVLVHNGEVLALAQDAPSPASGCKLDLGRLQDAAARVAGAMEAGADEALMLDDRGFVATCNSTHFFIVRKGELWTSGGGYCLAGITREAWLD